MSERFPQIPPPVIIEPDYDGTLKRVKTKYKLRTGHYPDTNDPETFQLEQLAYEREQLVDDINETAKQNLLGYATGANLDNLGVFVQTPRQPPSAATAEFLFTLTDDHPDTTIASGYEVLAADGETVFATTTDISVAAGIATTTAILTAQAAGDQGNNFLPGEINTPLTENETITSVTNTTTSQGGAPEESDDKYAMRIYLAPSSFSVAGPYDAYIYFARSASPAIADVSVWSPLPNDISICAVLDGGVVPDATIKQAILDQCSPVINRPLGDRVSVVDSTPVTAEGVLNIQVYREAAALTDNIKATARERADWVIESWEGKLGRDIVPEAIESRVQLIGGVYRATTTLEYQQLNRQQFPLVTITDIVVTVVDESAL